MWSHEHTSGQDFVGDGVELDFRMILQALDMIFCSCQMSFISSLNSGTPKVSVAVERESKRESTSSCHCLLPSGVPATVLAISSLVKAFLTAAGDGFDSPALMSSPLLALMRRL